MTKRLLSGLTTIAATAMLAAVFSTPPVLAASFDIGGEHLNECQGPERAAKSLKRMGYKNIERYAQYEKQPYKYIFGATKPKRDGKVVVWHL